VTSLRELTRIRRLTAVHVGTLTVGRIHVRRHIVEHVRSKHGLTVHATHCREEAHLVVLRLKNLVTFRFLLSKSKIKRLAVEEVIHNLLDGLESGLAGGKVTETEAPACAVGVSHDNAALNFSVLLEEVAKVLISHGVSKVADINVGLSRGGTAVEIALVPERVFTFVFLLSTVDIELLDDETLSLELLLGFTFSNRENNIPFNLNFLTLFVLLLHGHCLPLQGLSIQSFLGLYSIFVLLEIDETETAALTLIVNHDNGGSDLTILREKLGKVFSEEMLADVLHIHVSVCIIGIAGTEVLGDELLTSELLTKGLELLSVSLAGFESFLAVINLGELDETIAKASTIILGHNLAG